MKIIWIILLSIAAVIAVYILTLVIGVLFVDKKRDYDDHNPFYRWMLNSLTLLTLITCNVKIHVTGLEKMPKEGRYLIVGNHCSNFDSLIIWRILKKDNLAYISKPSNFKLPVLGRIVKRCCFLAIDRDNARNALDTMHKAADLIKKDVASIGIFPEGTRNKQGQGLLPFHNGVFKIAQLAEVPVVVVTVKGTTHIHKNAPFKRTHVYMDILEVIPAEYVKSCKRAALSDHVRKSMLSSLGETEDEALES